MEAMEINLGVHEIRTFLHLLAVVVWVGGQIVMLGLLPALRKIGGDAPKQAAAAFGRVSWPFFGLAVVTGVWNFLAVDPSDASTGWNIAFGIKFLLVIITGGAAFVHQRTNNPALRGATGGIGFIAALGAMALGVLMAH